VNAPIGRRREFDLIMTRLGLSQPSIVTIAGPVGSGRTSMLEHVTHAAVDLGYGIIGDSIEPIVVDATSNETSVLSRLQGRAAEEEPVDEPSSDGWLVRTVKRVVTRYDERRQILELLTQMAPLAVMVDGYRPTTAFGLWITGTLVPGLRESGSRIAFVVADTAERVSAVAAIADLRIELGPLDATEVRDHLGAAAAGLDPPMDPVELEQLVAATTGQPGLVVPLADVLSATAAATTEPVS
jgi:hypothetical protein